MTRPPLTSLSSSQKRILQTVLERENAWLPNFVSDLVAALGLKAESSLGATLQRMARLGVILIQGGGARGRQRLVVSTEKGRLVAGLSPQKTEKVQMLPLLGQIPAGPLEEVIQQNPEVETVRLEEVLPARHGDFLLRVKGDSMTGDGILSGDLVLIRPGVECARGEIAAVLTGGSDATLKRVYPEAPTPAKKTASKTEGDDEKDPMAEPQIRLKASNPAYPDMLVPASRVHIAGVFRGLIRTGK